MPIFGQKMSILSKLHYIIGQTCHPSFFPNFHKKYCSHAQILSKNVHSLKNTMFSHSYFVKNVHPLKYTEFSRHFFKIFMKNPCCNAFIWWTNVKFVKITIFYGPKKSTFSNYHEEMTALMPIFCQKNINSLKKIALMPVFCQKTSILSKTRQFQVIFFSTKTSISCPYFVKKTSNLSKTRRSYVFFFEFFIKTLILSCPNLVKRTLILSKRYYLMGRKNKRDALFSDFARKSNSFHAHFC